MYTRTHVLISAVLIASIATFSVPGRSADASKTAEADASPIPVTLILDETGSLAANGLPNELGAKLAIQDINSHGGVLGRQLKLTDLDSQSSQSKYVTLARKVADSNAAVVMGGILSASRAAIRPIFDRADKLYFYTQLYEGGVCDKDMFSTGVVPTQQLAPMLKYAVKKGLKKWYVIAANYNYGQISAQWVEHFAGKYGAEIVGGSPKFYALTHSNFSNVIPKIQASGADLIVSLLVGNAQSNFYKQWNSTGLNKTTKIMSPVYGTVGQEVSLGGAGEGVLAAFPYMPTANPSPNDAFAAAWKASGTKLIITPTTVSMWNAWHLWAAAANKAGSINRDKVIAALESGVTYDGPAGKVFFDGPTHQVVTPVRLWRDNGHGSFDLVKLLSRKSQPIFIQSKCNLIKSPTMNKQFTPQLGQ
jgi:branched-chain amino acid transport system substrate-binding protein